MTEEIAALGERVARLEHQRRVWRAAAAAGAVGLAAIGLMGQARPKVPERVEAREFVLRDAGGQVRARLLVKPDVKAALLHLFDPAGKARVELGIGSDGSPSLRLADQGGKLRAALSVGADGTPRLGFWDEAGRLRATLNMEGDGSPTLALTDQAGRVRWRVP